MRPVMGTLNDWHLVTVVKKSTGDRDDEEIALLFEDALQMREAEIEGEIVMNGKGIISDKVHKINNPNGYRLVEWLGEPYPLQVPTVLYGCGSKAMPVGSMVVKCKFWERIPNQDGFKEGDWFEKPELDYDNLIIPKRHLVWVRDILVGAVEYQHPSNSNTDPGDVFFRKYNWGLPSNKILISQMTIDRTIKRERHRLEKWNGVEMYQTLATAKKLPKRKVTAPAEEESRTEKEKKANEIRFNSLINK